ncbi:FG-GAP-like repeat-containing protein [Streptomyces sp. NPDC091292]|uniref:FG-GAP-like repeat-containing protein n=1 Tax=Streptomyces sp. NPDC091292 TaxID=3365991 RepID=UPI003808655B
MGVLGALAARSLVAFVAFVVSLALLLAGAAGPAAGLEGADSSAKRSASLAPGGIPGAAGASGAAVASMVAEDDGSITLTLDPGIRFDPQLMRELLDESNNRHPLLSDTIREEFEKHPVDLAEEGEAKWVDFDGTVSIAGETALSLTVPASDVGTTETWKQYFFAMAVGWLTNAAVTAACFVFFPELAVACPTLGGFSGGLLNGLVTQYFDGTLKDPKAIAKTFLGALKGALWAGAKTSFIRWLQNAFPDTARAVSYAIRDQPLAWARGAAGWVADVLRDIADLLPDGIAEWGLPPVAADRPLRVMVGGDSISTGFGSSDGNGYRFAAWSDLNSMLVNGATLDFVGSQRSGNMGDPDHEGHSGWQIAEIGQALHASVPVYQPNVVTLMAGTNDMNNGHEVATAPDRLAAVIDQILQDQPRVTVLVATLVPAASPTTQARITAFNAKVRSLVGARARAGKKVGLVDMSMMTTADLVDGLHPNDGGYQKMGHAFAQEIGWAIRAGWITDPIREPACSDTPGRWIGRGQIASGTGHNPRQEQIQFADLNGDGRADYLVVDDRTGAVRAWMNHGGHPSGNPVWVPAGEIAAGVGSGLDSPIVFADLNGDGRADYLVVTQGTGAVRAWMNHGGHPSGNPVWVPAGEIASGTGHNPRTERIEFADLNGDGRADYLVVNRATGAVRAWMNRGGHPSGNPVWVPAGEIASGTGHGSNEQVVFANIDCDKRADYLVVGNITGTVRAWLNRGGHPSGNPVWVPRGQIASGVGAGDQERTVLADIDGDGRADYLVVDRNTGAVRSWINKGGDPA